MKIKKILDLSFASLILLGAGLNPLAAATLTPNPASGNPSSVGPINLFTVSLKPDPALLMESCPWLIPAAKAAAQPYTNATNVWNFQYAAKFNGTFNMTQYAATNNGTNGGANFNIDYTPGAGDPTGKDVRWMQVIDTNMPSARGTTYGVAGTGANGIPTGTTAYLDNAGPGAAGTPLDPYYGWLTATDNTDITTSTAANSTHFSDTPLLPLKNGRDWEAQVFVASETDTVIKGITTHNVTLYGGVWWGFTDTAAVPEPETYLLFMLGGGMVLSDVAQKRRQQNNALGWS